MEFKIGDRVVVKDCYDNKKLNGKHGVIVGTIPLLVVKFDECHPMLHDGLSDDADCKHRCWFVHPDDIKLEETDVITIKRSGNVLIAFDTVNHKKAIAKCSPEDDFDLETGVKLAVNRLFEKEKPKYYTGKVVCVDSGDMTFYTKGKIYTIKDGTLTRDNSSNLFGISSVDELNKCSFGKWLEVVE